MGKRRRGRERLETCCSCGRTVPRDKAVADTRRSMFTTDLRGSEDNITHFSEVDVYYCISCAKHRKIFEKKKRQAQRRREMIAGGM
jgi:ribosomal protein S26